MTILNLWSHWSFSFRFLISAASTTLTNISLSGLNFLMISASAPYQLFWNLQAEPGSSMTFRGLELITQRSAAPPPSALIPPLTWITTQSRWQRSQTYLEWLIIDLRSWAARILPGADCQMLRGGGTGGCSIGENSVVSAPCLNCSGRHHL